MDNLLAASKITLDALLSLNGFSLLLGVLIGVYITYKLTVDHNRVLAASEAYKTIYSSMYIRLATIKINLELKKKELGRRNFRRLNKQCKKSKNVTLIAKQVLDVSDELHKIVKTVEEDKLSAIVISRYFAIEQIRENIKLAEISDLGYNEDLASREIRITRLQYELALAKISFVQSILDDMKKITKSARIKDKETRATIKFLLKTTKAARNNGVLKMYHIAQPDKVNRIDVKNLPAG